MRLYAQTEKQDQGSTRRIMFSAADASNGNWKANLSAQARTYLKTLGVG
jgi:hypothetical protein